MAAATKERKTTLRDGDYGRPSVAAGVKIFKGTIVVLTSAGYARPGRVSTTDKPYGIAQETVDNTAGADGAVKITCRFGVHYVDNGTAGDALTIADIGNDVYLLDDQTVVKTNGTNTRIRAGKLIDFDDLGPSVNFGPGR